MRKLRLLSILLLILVLLFGCQKDNRPSWYKELDFVLEVEDGRDIRILFLADTQLIDSSQMRHPDRLDNVEQHKWGPNMVEANCFNYIRDTIEMTDPDLIILVGDIVYGEFDDSGRSLTRLVNYLDSFGIAWAPIFGNHENESKMGVDWQCKTITDAKHSLFKRGSLSGNSNYTIGLSQGGKLIRVIYMIDSNGCSYTDDPSVRKQAGFGLDQLQWVRQSARSLGPIPAFVCYHIPTVEFTQGYVEAGYIKDMKEQSVFVIGSEQVPAVNGDFGAKWAKGLAPLNVYGLLDLFKDSHVDGVFVGHHHQVNTSVLYEGIRFTHVLKTGTYDSHVPSCLGGTYAKIEKDGSFSLEHKYVDKYPLKEDINP